MKTLKERIEIEQAYLNNKNVQHRPADKSIAWELIPNHIAKDNLVFFWAVNDYRIKPEPREFFVNVQGERLGGALYLTKERAEDGMGNLWKANIVRLTGESIKNTTMEELETIMTSLDDREKRLMLKAIREGKYDKVAVIIEIVTYRVHKVKTIKELKGDK